MTDSANASTGEAARVPTREDAYRVAFENGHEAIFIAQDGVFKAANGAAGRLVGCAPEEVVGHSLLDLIHPGDRALVAERYQRRIDGDATERSMTVRGVRPDGSVLWLEIHGSPVTWQDRPAVLAFIAEVTDLEAERRRAAERELLLTRVAEISPHFIFIYDYDLGRDVYINRSVPAALGYTPEQEAAMQPYPFVHLCHPEDREQALERDERWRQAADGTVGVVEFRLRHASGSWRWLRSLNTPFRRHPDGRVAQILGVSEDITDQRRAEETLRRSERLESLAVLAGGLAHDFGNLLTPVLGRAELLLARLPEDSPLRPHADAIRSAAEHAAELVEHLQVFSGRQPAEPRPIDLNDIALDVVRLLRPVAPRHARLELDLQPSLPHAVGDPSQIRQVVLNLVTNAFDAVAGRGGRIAVRSRCAELADADLARLELAEGMTAGPAIVLEVEDDGVGMDEETHARLWEPFFTTKPRGRGLGLPSVVGILRRHGGGMAVRTEAGRGSSFRCYLPTAPLEERAAAAGEVAR
jgi:PAS domain S-box-containing protein